MDLLGDYLNLALVQSELFDHLLGNTVRSIIVTIEFKGNFLVANLEAHVEFARLLRRSTDLLTRLRWLRGIFLFGFLCRLGVGHSHSFRNLWLRLRFGSWLSFLVVDPTFGGRAPRSYLTQRFVNLSIGLMLGLRCCRSRLQQDLIAEKVS